jgi:flagellar biosynthetic protein FliR
MTQAFVLGIRAAAPLLTALLLANLILGLISRTLPQINVIAVGFGVNSLLTLGLMMLTIGAAAWVFQDPSVDVMGRIQEALAH